MKKNSINIIIYDKLIFLKKKIVKPIEFHQISCFLCNPFIKHLNEDKSMLKMILKDFNSNVFRFKFKV